jgi:hypothetical protein
MILLLLLDVAAILAAQAGFYTSAQPGVAAAIELEADGKFAYSLDYGAVSEVAEGNWTGDGNAVYLTSVRTPDAYRQAGFVKQPLQIDGASLVRRRHDMLIRFNREGGLPTPPNRNTKLDKGN